MLPVWGTALVVALTAPSPVHVTRCDLWAPQTSINLNGIPESVGSYDLHVRFVNEGNQPIRRVVFVLPDGRHVVDAGKFAPGVMIDQQLPTGPEDDGASCNVASVTFNDGTEWTPQTLQ
jgi:hypothetical protein